jgi:hypothetical protein
MAVQRLTAAYRSRPRPSSAPDAKASTVRPSYLDGEPIDVCIVRRWGLLPIHNYWPLCSFQASPMTAGGGFPPRGP